MTKTVSHVQWFVPQYIACLCGGRRLYINLAFHHWLFHHESMKEIYCRFDYCIILLRDVWKKPQLLNFLGYTEVSLRCVHVLLMGKLLFISVLFIFSCKLILYTGRRCSVATEKHSLSFSFSFLFQRHWFEIFEWKMEMLIKYSLDCWRGNKLKISICSRVTLKYYF